MTFSITTLSIMSYDHHNNELIATLSIMALSIMTLGIMTINIKALSILAKHCYAERHI